MCARGTAQTTAEVSGHVQLPKSDAGHKPAAVVWLKAVDRAVDVPPIHPGRFTLVQKNRMFSPHMLVVPVGSLVNFPNADPFFHNVFSLFNGRRFDLGLYEAGTSKDVAFSREGASYIFCNIHPEMSAVVLALSTSLYAVADSSQNFSIREVTPGEYELHVWIEGTPQPALDGLTRHIRIRTGVSNRADIDASNSPPLSSQHLNKFGMPYDRDSAPAY
jgi:plastocyanin